MIVFVHSRCSTSRPKQQRGVGTLTISVILLICMTLVAFYVNKSQLFEQKTSANQLRSTKAFEAAEAGIEWATSMLNDPRYADASCTTDAAGATESFRKKYLSYSASSGFSPISNTQPGCSMSTTSSGTPPVAQPSLACSCPAAGVNPISLQTNTTPTFTIKFTPVASDTESVEVTSYGCTSADLRCVPGADPATTADAHQAITVILKLRPALKSVPAAAITTGGSLKLTSAASSVSNTSQDSNGILVNAGGGINSTAVSGCNGSFKDFAGATTLPGTPWQNSMIANDASLSSLSTDPDAMFKSYFGTTLEQYQADASTKKLTSCGSVETDFYSAYDQGYRSFHTTCDFQTNNNLGSAAEPVIFVTTGALKFNGGADIYGLIYGDQATWDEAGLGSGSINGALIVRGNYCANANAQYNYSADALKNIRGSTGTLARVPGSWKDF